MVSHELMRFLRLRMRVRTTDYPSPTPNAAGKRAASPNLQNYEGARSSASLRCVPCVVLPW